jgi:hypothetical protein
MTFMRKSIDQSEKPHPLITITQEDVGDDSMTITGLRHSQRSTSPKIKKHPPAYLPQSIIKGSHHSNAEVQTSYLNLKESHLSGELQDLLASSKTIKI